MINQCDGCQAGMVLIGGLHCYKGHALMVCTAHKYKSVLDEPNSKKAQPSREVPWEMEYQGKAGDGSRWDFPEA